MDHINSPLDYEDLLQEILLRLPPKPSSFPRASLVCKRWRNILSDPRFLHRFRKHHKKATLLGFFKKDNRQAPVFTPMLDPPDRIPSSSFALPENLLGLEQWASLHPHLSFSFVGNRHGIALFLDHKRREAVLWDPLTGFQRRVAFPPGFEDGKDNYVWNADVLCSAGDKHVHGDCHLSPFKLVFACHDLERTKASVCIYESKSGVWGDIISTTTTYVIIKYRSSVLVGNALCWSLSGGNILEFDFERLILTVIEKPANAHAAGPDFVNLTFQILCGEDNGLGLAVLSMSKLSIQLWARKSNSDGVVSWLLQNIVKLDPIFSQPVRPDEILSQPLYPGAMKLVLMAGYDEDTNVIFLSTVSHDFMLQLGSMQFKYICSREYKSIIMYYPYTHFYTKVSRINTGLPRHRNGVESAVLHGLSCDGVDPESSM